MWLCEFLLVSIGLVLFSLSLCGAGVIVARCMKLAGFTFYILRIAFLKFEAFKGVTQFVGAELFSISVTKFSDLQPRLLISIM